ncbi:MAG: response regulator [Devosia sp.]
MQVQISDGDMAVRSVLIVEDEALVSILIEDLVRDLGATDVQIFGNAASALKAAEIGDFDVAVLDVLLADGDSREIADALARRGIPFLFSTGSGSDSLPERHRDRPMIIKPFPDGDLQALLLKTLRDTRRDAIPQAA